MTIISIHVSPVCNYNHLFTINLYVIIIKLVTYRAIAIYDAYIVPRATEACEKLAVSEFNADLIADKRARVYRIINDTRSAEVSGKSGRAWWMIFALIPSDRANSQLVVSRRSWMLGSLALLSLSPSGCGRASYLFARFIFWIMQQQKERQRDGEGGEGKTSGRGPVGHSRANHAGHTLRVGRYVAAAGTGSSINLDHGVISPPLLWYTYHATNPGARSPFDS